MSVALPLAVALPAAGWAAPKAPTTSSAVSVLDYSQCQNDATPSTSTACLRWGNGILNSSNSHYSEDEVTPQRLLMSTAAGTVHTVTLRYMTRKGSAGAHAYDSLATWNTTQVGAQRCQGLKATDCPGGPESDVAMTADGSTEGPVGTGGNGSSTVSTHSLAGSMFAIFGGTFTGQPLPTAPTHSTAPTDTTSDDYAKVTLTFKATSSRTQLLFGGHLAASTGSRGWGTGLGSANISGGPYHIIIDSIDGASVGSRDNQISASAILAGSPAYTITKSVSPTNPSPGDTVTYTVTVKNTGTIAGATGFTDNFDDRLSPSTPTSTPSGGSCQREPAGTTDRSFTCTTSLIDPGANQVFTYTAQMPTAFSSGGGTGGCDAGSFPVANTATLTSGASASATACVAAQPDFTVTKTVSNPSAGPGVTVTYTITITNTGKAAGGTTWSDDFDDRVTNVSNATSGSLSCAPTTVSGNREFSGCSTGTINAGAPQVWTYTATMPAAFSGSPGGQYCPSSTAANPAYPVRNVVVLGNAATDDAVVCVPAQPSFTVTKTANPTVQSPGQPVTYTIKVHNGGSAAGSTTWTDDFNDTLTSVSAASATGEAPCAATTVSGNREFFCTTGTITARGDETWTYTATMPATVTGSPGTNGCSTTTWSINNTVTLTNNASDHATVCVTAAPAFTVTKSPSSSQANPGDPITYTITITNTGSAPGSTGWTDDFDDSVTNVSNATSGSSTCAPTLTGSNHLFSCTSGTIAAGSSQVWTYSVKMPTTLSGTPGGADCSASTTDNPLYPIANKVTLKVGGATAHATVCVAAKPSFTVTKSASPTVTTPGSTVTYTITISNGGTAAGSTTWTDHPAAGVTGLSDATSTGQPSCSPSNGQYSCSSGTVPANGSVTWTYTAMMPASFTGSPDPVACGTSSAADPQYPVTNVVTLANSAHDSATVCVSAKPHLTVTKKASSTSASPGDTITYTVTITNDGTAAGSTTWADDFDDRVTNVSNATSPGKTDCAPTMTGNHRFSCSSGTIAPLGGTEVWTYTATMPATLTGASGGTGCSSTTSDPQYPMTNVVLLGSGASDHATVCVHAHPTLTLAKSVSVSDASGQQVLTYTITYTNSGDAEASTATISDQVPAGTAYTNCTGGCATSGSPIGAATWTVGPVAPHGGTGSVTMTVVVTTTSACSVTNTATITAYGANGGNPVSSNTLVTPVSPLPDPAHANASGDAFGAQVTTYTLLDGVLSPVVQPLNAPSSSSQSGVGTSGTTNQALNVAVPALLSADVMSTTSTSTVTASPAVSADTSTSEAANVCLVPVAGICTVSASTVRAVAHADASGTTASFSANGSWIENLKVVGVATPVDLTQTTTIPLSALVFGAGSYVAINRHSGGTQVAGGSHQADLSVDMITVHITGVLGLVKTDITVGHASAHADFPVLTLCGQQVTANVSGHASIASAAVLPPLVLATQGFVGLPPSGGSEQQSVTGVSLVSGSLLTTGVASTSSIGSNGASSSTSVDRAQIANVCLLRFPSSTACVVTADAVTSVSTTTANGTAASKDVNGADATQLVNVQVRTSPTSTPISVAATVAPNSKIEIAGIGFLVLNEQTCDDGSPVSASNPRCTGTAHSGLTVSALHLVLLHQLGSFSPGVEVIVGQAHSDASYS